MARELFCSPAEVRAWAGVTDNTQSDAMLRDLIAAASQFILREIGLPSLISQTYSITVDGRGGDRLPLPVWPVTSVSALSIGGVAVAATEWGTGTIADGWVLEPWAGNDQPAIQGVRLVGQTFAAGMQNVTATFVAGFRRSAEAATIPATSPFRVQTNFKWIADHGVTVGGVAMDLVTGTPATGEYALGPTPGEYIFAPVDAGDVVAISYSYCPFDLWQACVEIVGDWYRKKERIGQVSKQLAGNETVTFSTASVPASALRIIVLNRRGARMA